MNLMNGFDVISLHIYLITKDDAKAVALHASL